MIFSNKDFQLRIPEHYRNCYNQANEGEFVYGFLGKPIVSEILELPNSIPIDYMHLVCLGILKNLAKLWFDSHNKSLPYFLGKKIVLIKKFFFYQFNI